jgi:3-hydroxyisobutyrate dehydrogenase-like beta-hydroxyacid dehydrogenase
MRVGDAGPRTLLRVITQFHDRCYGSGHQITSNNRKGRDVVGLRIGLIGTGEMGSAVGARLRANGVEVVTSLAGRSKASADRIARTGITIATSDHDVVAGSAFVLSIVPPGEAVSVAERYAPALGRMNGRTTFVDCNAIAPDTMATIASIVTGAPCIDVGIIGGPPRDGYTPTFYASGPDAAWLLALDDAGLAIKVLDGDVGLASAFKMCYAGITKGFTAVGSAMRAAAAKHGLADELEAELAASQPALKAFLDRQLPLMPPKAYRWVAEMHEIGRSTGDPAAQAMYDAFADLYAGVALEHGDAVRAAVLR